MTTPSTAAKHGEPTINSGLTSAFYGLTSQPDWTRFWRAISARDDKSHKLWTDDYLAAFAQASDATLTTLDRKMPARYPSVQVELLLS